MVQPATVCRSPTGQTTSISLSQHSTTSSMIVTSGCDHDKHCKNSQRLYAKLQQTESSSLTTGNNIRDITDNLNAQVMHEPSCATQETATNLKTYVIQVQVQFKLKQGGQAIEKNNSKHRA